MAGLRSVDRAVLAAVLAAAALAAPVPAAHGAADQRSVFMDDNRLLYRGSDVADATLRELRSLGTDTVRVSVHWRAIAPAHRALERPASLSDPADPRQYDPGVFEALDHLMRVTRQLGMGVLVNVTGGAPIWATGRLRGRPVSLQYRPDPNEFQRFMEMLGRRYDGTYRDENQGGGVLPRVEMWSIWNEPNQGALLQPQWVRSGGRWVPHSPTLYRRLVRAALQGLASSGHGRDTILLGETAPLGRGDRPGPTRPMSPGLFLRELFCLDRSLRALHGSGATRRNCDFVERGPLAVAGYAHHPYSVKSPPDRPRARREDIALADRARLYRLLDAGAAVARIPRDLPVWSTEYGYQTLPPDPIRGVSLDEQAEWNAWAELITRRDPRIVAHTQFLMRDDLPREGAPALSHRRWGTYQSGLEFANGVRKPAYDGYRLPFHAPPVVTAGAGVPLWGLVRPARGGTERVTIEFLADGAEEFSAVREVPVTDATGAFQATLPTLGDGLWRFSWEPSDALSPGLGDGTRPRYRSPAVAVRVG